MRIISQDKESDYSYDNSNIFVVDNDIHIRSAVLCTSERIGTYSTKEKALKVMKMIRTKSSSLDYRNEKKFVSQYFHMPQDAEVKE